MKKIFFTVTMIFSVFIFQFCSSAKNTTASGGDNAKPVAKTMYTSDIKPLLSANCTPCHFPPNGRKKALDNYASAKESIDDIISRVEKNPDERGFMPARHAKLSDSVIHVFKQWKMDGLNE